MGMQVMSGDSTLHFDEQTYDDEGDYLPSEVNGKEVKPLNDSLHPLILKIVLDQVDLLLVFEVNIHDLFLVSDVLSDDEGHPILVFFRSNNTM